MPLYLVISSPTDEPARFGYLHTSLSTLSHSDSVSGSEIAISRELAQSQYDLTHRDCGCSREIAISNPGTKSEWLSVETKVWRWPKRPGSSIGVEMIENDDIWRIGSNELCDSHCLITPLQACAPYVTVFDHFNANGQSRPFWLSTHFPLNAQQLKFCVEVRDCDLA